MNWAIYQSFARIPLGHRGDDRVPRPARARRGRQSRRAARPGVGRAGAVGVALLGLRARPSSTWPASRFALLAGAAWAAYILLSAPTGRRWPGLDGLAVASVVATVMLTPFAVAARRRATSRDPRDPAARRAVGLLSSVIPYSCELTALRTIRPSVFSILMSLEPAAAALAAIVVLQEFLARGAVGRGRGARDGRPASARPASPRHARRTRPGLTRLTPDPLGDNRAHDDPGPSPARLDAETTGRAGPAESVVEFHHILSDDGTRLRAWTNDPTRTHRRADRAALQRPRASAPGPGRRCCTPTAASGSSPGTTAAPAARPGPTDPAGSASRSSSRTPLSVMDHFGVDQAVLMGWSMGVNTAFELALRHPERVTGDLRGRRRARRHVRHHARPAAPAARRRAQRDRGPVPAARMTGRAITPDHHPAPVGSRTVAVLTHSRLHAADARQRADCPRRRVSSWASPSSGTSTSPCAPPSTPASR